MRYYRYYRIKQLSTGLFIDGFTWSRPLTSKGKERKTGPVTYKFEFKEEKNVEYYDNTQMKNLIRQAIRFNIEISDDLEIIAYGILPVNTSIKLKTFHNKIEAIEIMRRLKQQ